MSHRGPNWQSTEDAELIAGYRAKVGLPALAASIGRSLKSVRHRAYVLRRAGLLDVTLPVGERKGDTWRLGTGKPKAPRVARSTPPARVFVVDADLVPCNLCGAQTWRDGRRPHYCHVPTIDDYASCRSGAVPEAHA